MILNLNESKVELSNVLTMKELLKIKKDFLSYDKDKIEMITQEDARDCYIKYIEKLRWADFSNVYKLAL